MSVPSNNQDFTDVRIIDYLNAIVCGATPSVYAHVVAGRMRYGAALKSSSELVFWETEPSFPNMEEAIVRAKEIQVLGVTVARV